MEYPKITCLCPTYGRFQHLRHTLSCFLYQTYPNKELIILNDAPKPIDCYFPTVRVVNKEERYRTLGIKRQALLEMADSEIVAHWDDDDIYLPWHLEQACTHFEEGGMVKPEAAFRVDGRLDRELRWKGETSNWFEAMIMFDRNKALELGGYTEEVSGQTVRMIKRFKKNGLYKEFRPKPTLSFLFRWDDDNFHIQGGKARHSERFGRENSDFGDEPLRPKRVKDFYDVMLENGPNTEDFKEKLDIWLTNPMP